MQPTGSRERIQALDVLRGLGLLGIFIVNITGSYAVHGSNALDRAVDAAVDILATDSFYPLFSLLFGIGFALFLDRAVRNGRAAVPLFLRRIFVLAVIGLAQVVLLEPRDILLRYSLLALPLLAFRRANRRTLLAGAFVFLLLFALHGLVPDGGAVSAAAPTLSPVEQLLAYRPQFWQLRTLLQIFACFLFGLFLWRSGIVERPRVYDGVLRRCAIWGTTFGLAGKTVAVLGAMSSDVAAALLKAAAGPALTLGYAAGVTLLVVATPDGIVLRHAAAFGRMALTNYLLQSVVMALLFSRGAFGLTMGAAACVGVALAATAGQMLVSAWWLRRFAFGPMEWLWRTLTYGQSPAIVLQRTEQEPKMSLGL